MFASVRTIPAAPSASVMITKWKAVPWLVDFPLIFWCGGQTILTEFDRKKTVLIEKLLLDHNDPSKPLHRSTNVPEPSKTIESDGREIKKPSKNH